MERGQGGIWEGEADVHLRGPNCAVARGRGAAVRAEQTRLIPVPSTSSVMSSETLEFHVDRSGIHVHGQWDCIGNTGSCARVMCN